MKKLTNLLISETGGYMLAAFISGAGVALLIITLVLSIVLNHYQITPR